MRLGQTLAAERERAESSSERISARKKMQHRRWLMVGVGALIVAVFGLLTYLGVKELAAVEPESEPEVKYAIQAEIVDENAGGQISARVKEYIAFLEQDFQDLGYKVTRVTLPTDKRRTLYVDLEGIKSYFKVNIDRGTAVTAEDAVKMIKRLEESGETPGYVDVRVAGKAYYL